MPTILLFRHAKSDWGDPGLDDYDRPLAARGRKAAVAMGRHMRNLGLSPCRVLCSTAARAQQTMLLALNELGWDREVALDRGLYLAEAPRLLRAIRGVEPVIPVAMLIAHNPGMAEVAKLLTGGGPDDRLAALRAKFPTAALAEIGFKGHWSGVQPGSGQLVRFVVPRDLLD